MRPQTADAAVALHTVRDFSGLSLDYSTLPIMISRDSIVATSRTNASLTTRHSPSGGRMMFDAPPIHLSVLWYNNVFGSASLHFDARFRGSNEEFRYDDVNHGTYTVYDASGAEVFSKECCDNRPRSNDNRVEFCRHRSEKECWVEKEWQ